MARHRKLTQKFAGFPMFKLATSGDTFPVTSSFTTGFTGLVNDELALDLQFATDKTLTARKGPTPVFTRGSSGTFVGSDGLIQSAAINLPRFDHDPVTLACKGLLIEESRTNLMPRSQDFTTGWTPTNLQTVTSGFTSPAGDSTACSLVENNLLGIHSTQLASPSAITAGSPYTGSVYAKENGATSFQLVFSTTGLGAGYANFVLSGSGSVGTLSGVTATIERLGNGWYRCSMTVASAAGSSANSSILVITLNDNNSLAARVPSYLGDNATGIFIWGAQLETGSFATSYIPTTTTSVIRSADVCSITGSAFSGFYNSLEGSFAVSQIFNAPVSSTIGQVVFDVNDTTTLNRTRPSRTATTGFCVLANTVGGITDVNINGSTTITTGVVTKFAGCMKANDFTIYLNNVSQGVDTAATMQSSPTTFTIGDVSQGQTTKAPINGTISSIRYYRKRLPNAKLQELTV